MSSYYRIYCITEGAFQYEWRNDPPILCPNDNGHTINPYSISDQSEGITLDIVRLEFAGKKISGLSDKNYKKLTSMNFQGSTNVGYLKKIVINNIMDGNDGDTVKPGYGFYMRIYDTSNAQIVHETDLLTCSNLDNAIIITDILETYQTSVPASWQLQLMKGDDAKDLFLDGLDLYFYKV